MGAINYGTSDYITLGIKPYDASDYTSDPEFMAELEAEETTRLILQAHPNYYIQIMEERA